MTVTGDVGVPVVGEDATGTPDEPTYPTIPPPMAADVVAMWAELSNVTKTRPVSAGPIKYSYADLGDLLAVARPILAKHNLALLQPLTRQDSPTVTIHTMLIHTSGHVLEWLYDVQAGTSPQQTGSGVTYGRRYAAGGALGVAFEDDDDDGAKASTPPPADESFDDAQPRPSLIQTQRAVKLFDALGATETKARTALVSEIMDRDVKWAQLAPDDALVVLEALAERVDALKAAAVDAP